MIQMLIDHGGEVATIASLVAIVIGGYWRITYQVSSARKELRGFKEVATQHWIKIETDLESGSKDFKEHLASSTPHLNCPVHTQAIDDMSGRLDRIQRDISGIRDDLGELNRTLLVIASQGTKSTKD